MPVINLPSAEQFQELINVQRLIAGKAINDFTNSPGSKTLLKGDTYAGFYGFVQPSEMGLITANAEGFKDFNGTNLALACGFASGIPFNSNVPLMKFHSNGEVLFIPMTGYKHSVSWDDIYNAGMAYDTTDEGFLPPCGRAGVNLTINSADNSINTTTQHFLGDKTATTDSADAIGVVGDKLILKGWTNAANNATLTIISITDAKIIVSGATLITETGGKTSRIYSNAKKVTQGKTISIGNKSYKIRLITGAGDNPTDAFMDLDRGSTGTGNRWNSLILPMHEHAKLGNWAYPLYAKNKDGGNIEDWGVGLTDKNLHTHNTNGLGSYNWCQETIDFATWRRVYRGNNGVSFSSYNPSWSATSFHCWRPVLVAI